ncbi:dethiobiotin synthase [Pseudaeromonas sharmana]|uniref:ATP-dependent dethiobiotin synthetase BioD n=1 Tax=Pseudaeromonas sharmana TaxID=328412 RepID=A0ABV8CJP8_9GAMM
MTKTFFITGTDTEVGKTVSTVALLRAANKQGLLTAAYKPVASGCDLMEGGLCNQDVVMLQKNTSLRLAYDEVVGYCFEPHIAPHIAAEESGVPIEFDVLSEGLNRLRETDADLIFVEGAGGWRLPLGHGHFMSDWVRHENLPVILVVGAKLGCMNHAMLTYEAIQRDHLPLAGWCINQIHPGMSHYQSNVDTLKSLIQEPFLGEIPYLARPFESDLGHYLNISALRG